MRPFEPEKESYGSIPKVELHLHLEGAIPYDALWQLVQKYGGDPSAQMVFCVQTGGDHKPISTKMYEV